MRIVTAVTSRLSWSAKRFSSFVFFVRCKKGATVVEFAFVAAPFIALLVAIVQATLVFFAGRVLDETTEQASRYIMTGQAQTSGMTQAGFTNRVCSSTFASFTCGNFMVNVQNYSSFSSASTTTPTLTFNGQGQVSNSWSYTPATRETSWLSR